MASFTARIGWKRPRKKENKSHPHSSYHRLNEDEKGGKEKLLFRSVPT